jgi:hypothetical protein
MSEFRDQMQQLLELLYPQGLLLWAEDDPETVYRVASFIITDVTDYATINFKLADSAHTTFTLTIRPTAELSKQPNMGRAVDPDGMMWVLAQFPVTASDPV